MLAPPFWLFRLLASAIAGGAVMTAAVAEPVRDVVLVHGAFVDGSGWRPVFDRLTAEGYRVTIVQEPLTSLADDVAATRRAIALQPGPVLLVAHSYGGTVITEAGNDPKVVGLVYIAAHEPDDGETEAGNGKRMPALAKPPLRTPDGFLYLDPARFPEDFAADMPRNQATFAAHAQIPTAAAVFSTPVRQPAWKTKPSWALVAGSDRIISPDLERMYAKRAGSHQVEVAGASHAVFMTHPDDVATLIEQAAAAIARAPSGRPPLSPMLPAGSGRAPARRAVSPSHAERSVPSPE